jgi:hypothetical protein
MGNVPTALILIVLATAWLLAIGDITKPTDKARIIAKVR